MPKTVMPPAVATDVGRDEPSRRRFLRALGALALGALAAPTLAVAEGHAHQHGHEHGHAHGQEHGHAHGHAHQHGHGAMPGDAADRAAPLPAQPIPWESATCAFCDMTIATPDGAPQGPLFRERTYAQWVLPADAEGEVRALHFESIACALNYAYVYGLRDGASGTLYVTDAAGSLPAGAAQLLLARHAVFHWGEHLRVAMMARLIAFGDADARAAHAAAHPDEGRQVRYALDTLEDLAPLPEMNLIPLLARHAGLLEGA